LQREVLRHCAASSKTTSFALVTDEGTFLKLDDAGNSQVMSQAGGSAAGSTSGSSKASSKNLKNMKVSVNGTVEGDTLKVTTLSKM